MKSEPDLNNSHDFLEAAIHMLDGAGEVAKSNQGLDRMRQHGDRFALVDIAKSLRVISGEAEGSDT